MKKALMTVAAMLALSTTVFAEDYDVIRVGVDAPYPPFEYRDTNGELTGFEIELGNAVCNEITGQDCEWVIQAWDGIIPGLLARKYDMIFSSMSINPERAERVLFSDPYYTTPSAFFAVDGNGFDAENTAGTRIGVQRATIQDTYLTELHGDAEIVRYTTADDVLVDLEGGRLDAMFIDVLAGQGLLEGTDGISQVSEDFSEPASILGEGVGAAFRKRDTALEEAVSEALEKFKNDGTYDAIMEKYFDSNIKI
ncbi:transporter substrate-binding domain-containing protein [Saccharospirillum sp. HFRX-1]|uniref:transporter substrate-binding domain-containing protein n=1 Tax=unclassified Saccharospirillum TaxID=2633430 RepID=UPI0037249BDA